MSLLHRYASDGLIECGCDEVGRRAPAGDLCAATVIWPDTLDHPHLRDSKKLTAEQREGLRHFIEEHVTAWAVGMVTVQEIQQISILHAPMLAIQRAVEALSCTPEHLLIDGNYYDPRPDGVEYHTIVRGDDRYLTIAAASILAKTHRDEYMTRQALEYPYYSWEQNKGYPTAQHRKGIRQHGSCPLHRQGFQFLQPESLFDLGK